MTTNTRTVDAPAPAVWDVLTDGWLYGLWVVGASRIRKVSEDWPAVGSKIHHSVGVWPLLLDDHTEVVDSVPGSVLRLRAHGWPAGEAEVVIRLRPVSGSTEVSIEEDAVAGPGALVPRPLRAVPLKWRNTETLRRLAYLAERRS